MLHSRMEKANCRLCIIQYFKIDVYIKTNVCVQKYTGMHTHMHVCMYVYEHTEKKSIRISSKPLTKGNSLRSAWRREGL